MREGYDIVILGLSVTSSWGNGHATTYRGLIRALAGRGYRVLFLERNMAWHAGNRDEAQPAGAHTEIYESFDDLVSHFECEVREAGLVIVGSFVPEGARVGEWVQSVAQGNTAFYDINTPITLAKLVEGSSEYISPEQIRRYHIYFSFTGGPVLRLIERRYGSPMARPLYCAVNVEDYRPMAGRLRWDLGYLGTYSDDRQPALDDLLLRPSQEWPEGRFSVVGPMYPESIQWPANVDRMNHLSPREHPGFYGSQRFTLNIARAAMKRAGYSPSVRLFEAGACAVPVISDWWEGLDSILEPGREILISENGDDTSRFLRDYTEAQRLAIGVAARQRILAQHTPAQRALELESYWKAAHDHFSAHSPRRYRRRGQGAGRLVTGMAPEPPRATTGKKTHGTSADHANRGGVHEPAGASR